VRATVKIPRSYTTAAQNLLRVMLSA
jgi:hypothetical protein